MNTFRTAHIDEVSVFVNDASLGLLPPLFFLEIEKSVVSPGNLTPNHPARDIVTVPSDLSRLHVLHDLSQVDSCRFSRTVSAVTACVCVAIF